ncbi:Fe-S cluster assembly protein SufD [Cesiribacter andamanensis]|uniref:FeS cluster assembly protein sufD n=1 Tax=Cesiribacter andamanensis AMV16 TaxID=1279009 RepID=M7N9G6_9BACT|nr:Fe-S cluster assembly protein SufD [Cesiribacter andamanensis]EMR03907.1 FeS cluster assembly protein sufD [Cesiribacter andamanensis AMV16]
MNQHTATTYTQTIQQAHAAASGSANPSLRQIRERGIQAFGNLGLPHPKHEEYRYTPIVKTLEREFAEGFSPAPITLSPDEARQFYFEGLQANRLVFINGHFSPEASQILSPEGEIRVRPLSEVSEQLQSSVSEPEKDGFVALNTAYAEEGALIEIPAKAEVSLPVVLHFLSDSRQGKTAAMPRNFIRLGRHAKASVVEVYNTIGESTSFLNALTEVDLADGAQLDYFKIQTEGDHALQVNTTEVQQASNSRFSATTLTLGGRVVRNNLTIAQNGSNCHSDMYGLYMLHGKQHVDNHTLIDHRQPNSTSNELYKGIMDDTSTGVFNGKIWVQQAAQKTNAFQSNKNILLTNGATIYTKPQLEIWADDVKCSHGCTTGQLDDEQVFYLRSRGIEASAARALLLYAFAADIIEHITIEQLKEHFLALINDKLETRFV